MLRVEREEGDARLEIRRVSASCSVQLGTAKRVLLPGIVWTFTMDLAQITSEITDND